jgi:hypothetical protein
MEKKKFKDIWVTTSLPLIVFLLFRCIINILYGDILKIFLKISIF